MQQPSPALSSPSTGFLPRASPLFTPSSLDQPDHHHHPLSSFPPLPPSLSHTDDHHAPPKQLAMAMDTLSHAIRLIGEVRLGGDLLIEAVDRSFSCRSNQDSNKAILWINTAADSVRQSLDALRVTGQKLESSGVLNGAQQRFEEKQPWGLQIPLVCPDGAIVPYSWKRQIAGQAAASAVDRTRLALKAFMEQKRHFFPCLGDSMDDSADSTSSSSGKRPRTSGSTTNGPEQGIQHESFNIVSLSDLVLQWQQEVPDMLISSFTRLDWTKRSCSSLSANTISNSVSVGLPSSASDLKAGKQETTLDTGTHIGNKLGVADACPSPSNNVAILEVIIPTIFKAVISLLPGTNCPDGIAVFSSDEVGSHVHPFGVSVHNVFQRISDYGKTALQNFVQFSSSTALGLLLQWIHTYRSLFTKPCSQCKRILAFDRPSDLLLPPIVRPLDQVMRARTSKLGRKVEVMNDDKIFAYHLACTPKLESTVL